LVQLPPTSPTPPTLLDLPILKCWPLDCGRFITLPCVVTKDPDTGERNVGMYRIQIYDDKTTGMHWQLQKVGARHGRRYYETGTRMPVAVFLGGDPVFTFAATAPLPDGLDEFLLAGYLRKKSVELVKCETNDLEVPANADFVIEGYVDPTEPLRDEGPFGDHTGYYTLPEPYPVFHVTAITHRKDAVYPATIVGIPPMEDFYIGADTSG
jgi:4-hydroxy-3-polyprenylbenzoate decarboxylase